MRLGSSTANVAELNAGLLRKLPRLAGGGRAVERLNELRRDGPLAQRARRGEALVAEPSGDALLVEGVLARQ